MCWNSGPCIYDDMVVLLFCFLLFVYMDGTCSTISIVVSCVYG